MRTPVRSETEAFRLAIATVLVVGAAVLVGWLVEPLAGVALLVLAVAVAAVAYLRAADPDRRSPLRAAAQAPHPHGAPPGGRHVLVIANEALAGEELRGRIVGEEPERVEVDVLAPVLTSRMHYGVTDIDRELEQARARLRRSLAWARDHGIEARGEVGDPSASSAIEDELRDFGADEVIVVTGPHDRETWQEHGELNRLRGELDIPVSHVVVDGADAAHGT